MKRLFPVVASWAAKRVLFALTVCVVLSCIKPEAKPVEAVVARTKVQIWNPTTAPVTVYFAFGPGSVVTPANWPFCHVTAPGNCVFILLAHSSKELPLAGKWLNATLAFNRPVGCGSTKAELNVNNPAWYNILDVSLVDGFSNGILIESGTTKISVASKDGNEKRFGVYPLGCDICVARQQPSCGFPAGKFGCKGGTQYKPDVPCQYQGTVMGGGNVLVKVSLLPTAG